MIQRDSRNHSLLGPPAIRGLWFETTLGESGLESRNGFRLRDAVQRVCKRAIVGIREIQARSADNLHLYSTAGRKRGKRRACRPD